MSTHANNPPPIRRVVTGHAPDGKAIVEEDALVQAHPFGDPTAPVQFTDLFWTDTFPPDNNGAFKDVAKEHETEVVSAGGSVFRAVDMPPGSNSPFHRTLSLDYALVVKGTVTCVLDDDKRVTLRPGDVLVQRGTIHAWVVEGDEWARLFFCLLPAGKVKTGERELDTEFHPFPHAA